MDSSVLEFGLVHICKQGLQSKIKNRMANSAAISSESTLFAQVLVLVCLVEKVKIVICC